MPQIDSELPVEVGVSSPDPEVVLTETSAVVLFRDLRLTGENPKTQEIGFVVEKHPMQLVAGESYNQGSVLIDSEKGKMEELGQQAEGLRAIEESQRPRAVLELLRTQMKYAYADTMEQVAQENPALAEWVASNTGLDAPSNNNVPLSELLDNGYGVCKQLSVAYLWLAQKAGLEGTFMGGNTIKNIRRTDTGQKLFQSVDIGQPAHAHAWVEIKTSDEWIPVDPSTQLVGDTPVGLAMFHQANYLAQTGGHGVEVISETKGLAPSGTTPYFKPTEAISEPGKVLLLLMSTKPTFVGLEIIPPSNTPFYGDATMRINVDAEKGDMNLSLHTVR